MKDTGYHLIVIGLLICAAALILIFAKACNWQQQIPKAYAYYEPPSSCSLEVVICPEEIKEPSVEEIISIIAQLETQNGKTGVGATKHNPTGIKNSKGLYQEFQTLEEGLLVSAELWRLGYSNLDIDSALAKWKTGNPQDRSPQTLKYISDFYSLI